jgi:hypothetical protein
MPNDEKSACDPQQESTKSKSIKAESESKSDELHDELGEKDGH